MEFLKFRDVRWKGQDKRNKPDVVATTAKHPDSRSQISRYGKGTCAVSHFRENLLPAAVSEPAVAICLNSLLSRLSYTEVQSSLLKLPYCFFKTLMFGLVSS